jgi:predicted CoA-binding protein
MKKTLVIGASLNPSRYSNLAIHKLVNHHYKVVAIGLKEGEVAGVKITKERQPFNAIDTITLYLNAERQRDYYDYIISLKPKRVIFNPGTENPELYQLLTKNNIDYEVACTLVLLSTNQY